MKVYQYWAQAKFEGWGVDGEAIKTAAYAGSNESQQDAQALASQELQRRVNRLHRYAEALDPEPPFQDYPPPTRAIREELLWRQDGPDGQPVAAMTRSRNGYLVLNTTHLMMVDVDHLPRWNSGLKGLLQQILTPRKSPPELKDVLQTWLARHPDWGLRVYRTKAGYRYLITHAPLPITDPAHLNSMEGLHADFMYVRLCRQQQCYRARLTPKTHRVRWRKPDQTFPYQNEHELAAQKDWEQSYNAIIERYTTVELIGQFGNPSIHPELQPLIELHDQHALKPGLPLA